MRLLSGASDDSLVLRLGALSALLGPRMASWREVHHVNPTPEACSPEDISTT
jgi:hypothetical protein